MLALHWQHSFNLSFLIRGWPVVVYLPEFIKLLLGSVF
jgi:hypothetical protein